MIQTLGTRLLFTSIFVKRQIKKNIELHLDVLSNKLRIKTRVRSFNSYTIPVATSRYIFSILQNYFFFLLVELGASKPFVERPSDGGNRLLSRGGAVCLGKVLYCVCCGYIVAVSSVFGLLFCLLSSLYLRNVRT